ncbi:Dephospho-CoA kinase [Aquimixticola soesokkakensis]|uniref:Dephospho-CoA kinase n=1 Tax=Aquimixticola soesokkakensis TaxID=1519096 RepID=A0A1Y5RAJ9_9RHOB|nr:dephospho-CoA kinase [Aquimixticola soesokkakensis]SLN11796.1 Dephospho-CoA kinase [Aquimixticola soesokkakensis]
MSRRPPYVIGLTGSIGMGKSTTARMFAARGVAVWDADAAVHRLYAQGGAAVAPLGAVFPDAIIDKAVSRPALKEIIAKDTGALRKIEAVVHPLVVADRAAFIAAADGDLVLLDIPLLFETGAQNQVDAVVVVSVPSDIQQARVMARGTMTQAQFDTILAKQMPDAEKRARADYVIETRDLDSAARQVAQVLADIERKRTAHA